MRSPPDISNRSHSGNSEGGRNRTRERPEVDISLIKTRQCSWISVFFLHAVDVLARPDIK